MNNAPRNLRLLQTFPPLPNRFCRETAEVMTVWVEVFTPGVRMLDLEAAPIAK